MSRLPLRFSASVYSQKAEMFNGVHLHWCYSIEWCKRSNIHFKVADGNNFTLKDAKANDKPDFNSIAKNRLEVSLPQHNYRNGFYLNPTHSKAIKVNFDHIKYVVANCNLCT